MVMLILFLAEQNTAGDDDTGGLVTCSYGYRCSLDLQVRGVWRQEELRKYTATSEATSCVKEK